MSTDTNISDLQTFLENSLELIGDKTPNTLDFIDVMLSSLSLFKQSLSVHGKSIGPTLEFIEVLLQNSKSKILLSILEISKLTDEHKQEIDELNKKSSAQSKQNELLEKEVILLKERISTQDYSI